MGVKLETLRLDTLGELDGRIEQLFQKHLAVIRADCENRPNDSAPRKLTLELSCVPIAEAGELDEVEVAVSAKSVVPVFKTKKFRLKPTREGLKFNSDIPEELDQPALM